MYDCCFGVDIRIHRYTNVLVFGFWFLICYVATQLATLLQQRRIQVVRSNKVAWKRLTESNGTPAMDFGCEEIRKRRYTQTKNEIRTLAIEKLEIGKNWRFWYKTSHFEILLVHDLLQAPRNSGRDNAAGITIV